jgi:hypothetical protein
MASSGTIVESRGPPTAAAPADPWFALPASARSTSNSHAARITRMSGYLIHQDVKTVDVNLRAASQGLTLVHFSAQPEPFLTQNTP